MNVRFSDNPRKAASAPRVPLRWVALLAAVLALTAAAPSHALARGGGGGGGGRAEVRAAGTCGKGASSKLRLRREDGSIEVEFEVQYPRSGAPWSVVIVREGRIAWRGRARPRSSHLSVTRRLGDLGGADRVMARGVGPRGVSCVASATLPG